MLDYAKKQLREVLVTGLAHSDIRERRASAAYIAQQLLPGLYENGDMNKRQTTFAALSRLVMERRPPRDDFEDLGLDDAILNFVERHHTAS